MAIKRIQETTSKNLKPYLSEFVLTLDKKELKKLVGTLHGVVKCHKTKSKKGWIIQCDQFSVFVWSKSKSDLALQESVEDTSYGYPMIEIKDQEGNFSLVFDDEFSYSIQEPEENCFLFLPISVQSNVDTEKENTTETF